MYAVRDHYAGCLQLLEIFWNLKSLLEILEICNVIDAAGKFNCRPKI